MTRIPANLRINADDFGLSQSISRAILKAAHEGWVNSTSVVPFQDSESAALFMELLAIPGVNIGAHLTFIEVPLLSRPQGFSDGIPPSNHRAFLRAWVGGQISPTVVEKEWKSQLELLRDRMNGKPIHHLDSHQHIHLLPGLWDKALDLKKEFGIPVLRLPHESSRRAWTKDFPRGAALQALTLVRSATEERFFGVGTSMGFRAEAYADLARKVAENPDRNYELMVHPGEDERGRREMEELGKWLQFFRN